MCETRIQVDLGGLSESSHSLLNPTRMSRKNKDLMHWLERNYEDRWHIQKLHQYVHEHKLLNLKWQDDICTVSGRTDQVLITLSKTSTGFPRGFAIVPDGKELIFSGFYGKFSNGKSPHDTEVCSFKYGGSLLILAPTGKIMSKNSGNQNSEFILRGREMLHQEGILDNETLMNTIHRERITLCFEVMHEEDENHGAPVHKNAVVLTCVSWDNPKTEPFLEYMDFQSMWEFANKHKIPCVEWFKPTAGLIDKLPQVRGSPWPLHALQEVCQQEGVEIYVNHSGYETICGPILEGVISDDPKGNRVKDKFFRYIITTMVLRGAKQEPRVRLLYRSYKLLFDWLTDPYAEDSQRVLQSALYAFDSIPDDQSTRPIIDKMEEYLLTSPSHGNVSGNVQTIILSLGPINSGKSTIANKIVERDPETLVHIDGDNVGFSGDSSSLGRARNVITLSEICYRICQGYVPIVSQGGGAIMDLRAYLSALMPDVVFEIFVIVPENADHDECVRDGINNTEKYPNVSHELLLEKSKANQVFIDKFIISANNVISRSGYDVPHLPQTRRATITRVHPLFCGAYCRPSNSKTTLYHITWVFNQAMSPEDVIRARDAFFEARDFDKPEKVIGEGKDSKFVALLTPVKGLDYGHITLVASHSPMIAGKCVDAYNRGESICYNPDADEQLDLRCAGQDEYSVTILGFILTVASVQ